MAHDYNKIYIHNKTVSKKLITLAKTIHCHLTCIYSVTLIEALIASSTNSLIHNQVKIDNEIPKHRKLQQKKSKNSENNNLSG